MIKPDGDTTTHQEMFQKQPCESCRLPSGGISDPFGLGHQPLAGDQGTDPGSPVEFR